MRVLILYCLMLLSDAYKIVSIAPGGLKGFYTLGICKYLKEHYCLDECRFYGSSAGSWNSVFLGLPSYDDNYYFESILKLKPDQYSSLNELEICLKNIILNEPSIKDNNVTIETLNQKCNICVSEYKGYRFKKTIKSEFENWEDLLECCIASSHLPYISNGDLFYNYQNKKVVDGGLFRKNYPRNVKEDLSISHKMFHNKEINKHTRLNALNIELLVYTGYKDARENFDYFNKKLMK